MDNIDRITELEQRLFDLRLKMAIRKPKCPSAPFCKGCGAAIPASRRKTLPGVQLCVGCKKVEEMYQRSFWGRL